jgi:hypothetical protein
LSPSYKKCARTTPVKNASLLDVDTLLPTTTSPPLVVIFVKNTPANAKLWIFAVVALKASALAVEVATATPVLDIHEAFY